MSAVLKPCPVLSRAELERLAAEVDQRHRLRLDQCLTIPLVPRGRNVKKRPRTAIISRAAQRLIEERETRERFAALANKFCGATKT